MGKKRKKNKDQVPVFELTELREFIALDQRRAERGAGFHDDRELPSDLLSVAILDAADPGSVSPELALKAFEYDRDALLRGIGTCQREVLAWDEVAAESGHPVDEGEAASWRETEVLLTAALRLWIESVKEPGRTVESEPESW
jgi:hypothetical protein